MIRYKISGLKLFIVGALALSSSLTFTLLFYSLTGFGWVSAISEHPEPVYYVAILISTLIFIPPISSFLQVELHPAPYASLKLALRYCLIQASAFAVFYFTFKNVESSRLILGSYFAISGVISWLVIYAAPGILRWWLRAQRPSRGILIGYGHPPDQLMAYLDRCSAYGIRFYGYYSEQRIKELSDRMTYLDDPDRLDEISNPPPPGTDVALIYARNLAHPALLRAILECQNQGFRTEVYPVHGFGKFADARYIQNGNLQFLSFFDEPLRKPVNIICKRAIDIVASSIVILTVLPPLTLLVWIAQRFQSPGPVFFKQRRLGIHRYEFNILKFRTMRVPKKDEVSDETIQASSTDTRIYPFGKFLRRSSLDEFPQFINVLKGEMSLVGPRPHLPEHDSRFEREMHAYRIRHFVKPGITGYAQIRGCRGEITHPSQIDERVEKDVYYIKNWSPQLDLYITLKTIVAVIKPPKSAV